MSAKPATPAAGTGTASASARPAAATRLARRAMPTGPNLATRRSPTSREAAIASEKPANAAAATAAPAPARSCM